MQIKRRNLKEFIIISLVGDMEAYDAERFENRMIEIIKGQKGDMIIDLKDLKYISSSGLRALLNIRSQLLKQEGRLLLVSLKDKVLDTFRVSKLIDVFDVYKDVDNAIGGIKP